MIKIKNDNNIEMKNEIRLHLRKDNRVKCKWLREHTSANIIESNITNHNFLAFDNDVLVGGAIGFVQYHWYFLDLLWIDETYRGQDIGTSLMKQIEEFSIQENLVGIRMETWDFQARGFYEKLGYTVFAEIENCPPGNTVYFLKKNL